MIEILEHEVLQRISESKLGLEFAYDWMKEMFGWSILCVDEILKT